MTIRCQISAVPGFSANKFSFFGSQDLLQYFNPKNARVDFMSTTFGRVTDFDQTFEGAQRFDVLEPSIKFSREKAGPPRREDW